MKRALILCAFAFLLTLLLCFSVGAEAELPDLSGVRNVYVYNIENKRELYSKGHQDRIEPASTAKMMTGILALAHYKDRYGELITVTKESLGGFRGKNINLKDGETVTVEGLLYAVICGGANDAANVLAYNIAGSHDAFVAMMNEKAKELGMTDTYYANANGYTDSAMYTTARDTALLAEYAFFVKEYMDMCTVERYVFPQTNVSKTRYIYNSNYLIATNVQNKYKNKEVQGMNAGSTTDGGYVLVTAVSREGKTNVYVLMGGGSDEENIYTYTSVKGLVDWSYESFDYVKILDSGEMICEMEVGLSGSVDYVVLSPEKSIEYFLPTSVDVEKDIKKTVELFDKTLEAPIEAGYVAGVLTLEYKGEVLAKVDLITKNNVDRNGFLYVLARIKSFTRSDKFKVMLWCIAGVFLLYVAYIVYKKTRSNTYRYKYGRYRRK